MTTKKTPTPAPLRHLWPPQLILIVMLIHLCWTVFYVDYGSIGFLVGDTRGMFWVLIAGLAWCGLLVGVCIRWPNYVVAALAMPLTLAFWYCTLWVLSHYRTTH